MENVSKQLLLRKSTFLGIQFLNFWEFKQNQSFLYFYCIHNSVLYIDNKHKQKLQQYNRSYLE